MNMKLVFVFVAAVAATSAASNIEDIQSLFLQVQNGAGRKHAENDQIRAVISKMKKELEDQHKAALAQLEQHEKDRDAVIAKFEAMKDKKAEDMSQFDFDFAAHSKTIQEELKLLEKLTNYVETTLKDSFMLDGKKQRGTVVRGDKTTGTSKIGNSEKLSATKSAASKAVTDQTAANTERANQLHEEKENFANNAEKQAKDAAAAAKQAADAAKAKSDEAQESAGNPPTKAALMALLQKQLKGQHRRLLGQDITSLLEVAAKVSKLDMSNKSDKADYMKLFAILKKFKQKLLDELARWNTLKKNQLLAQKTVNDEADAQILAAKKEFMQFVQRQVLEEEDRNKQLQMLEHIESLVNQIEGVKTTEKEEIVRDADGKVKRDSTGKIVTKKVNYNFDDYKKSEAQRKDIEQAMNEDKTSKTSEAKNVMAAHRAKNAETVENAHRQGGKKVTP